jgi:hypothetical protein
MKFKYIIIGVYLTLLCSCEQLKEFTNTKVENNESSSVPTPSIEGENKSEVKAEDVAISKSSTPPSSHPAITNTEPAPIPITKPEPNSEPEQPEFSPELLSAVKNWQFIPKSVFPLAAVTIRQPIEFVAKTKDGQVVASAVMQPGEEVVAMGLMEKKLIVAPSLETKLRGNIDVQQTDFKQGVAYLFELRKKQREEYERKKEELAKLKNTNNHSVTIEETAPSLEALPIPGDFGHGKFCICKECREKRLAVTGSMK